MNTKAHKEAIAEDHNRQYKGQTASEDEEMARKVIELIQSELEPETLKGWRDSCRSIENRVKKSLGLQSKYRADGTVR
jgi:hypothetical protein